MLIFQGDCTCEAQHFGTRSRVLQGMRSLRAFFFGEKPDLVVKPSARDSLASNLVELLDLLTCSFEFLWCRAVCVSCIPACSSESSRCQQKYLSRLRRS